MSECRCDELFDEKGEIVRLGQNHCSSCPEHPKNIIARLEAGLLATQADNDRLRDEVAELLAGADADALLISQAGRDQERLRAALAAARADNARLRELLHDPEELIGDCTVPGCPYLEVKCDMHRRWEVIRATLAAPGLTPERLREVLEAALLQARNHGISLALGVDHEPSLPGTRGDRIGPMALAALARLAGEE